MDQSFPDPPDVSVAVDEFCPVPILLVHFGDGSIRGSEQVLLELLSCLNRSRFLPILWCNGSILAEHARALGVTTYETPMQFFLSATSLAFNYTAWRRQLATAQFILRRHKVRLLHANSGAPVQWLVPVARSLHLPLLAHLHAPYLRRDRFMLLLHQTTLVVGVSRPTLEGLATDGMSSARLRLVPNGINPARLLHGPIGDLREQLGIPRDAFVIGSVGSLIPRKGLDMLLAAFAHLDCPGPAHLILAGSGPERTRLETLACELGVTQRVHFLGNIDTPGHVYRAMDVNVLASRQEAFGLVLVEAALCGVPSIGSSVGGIPEVIEDGITGFLFSRDDGASLANRMKRLAEDATLRRHLGNAARHAALAQFTAARMAERFGKAYSDLLMLPPSELGWAALRHVVGPYLSLPLRLRRHG